MDETHKKRANTWERTRPRQVESSDLSQVGDKYETGGRVTWEASAGRGKVSGVVETSERQMQ